MIYTEKTLSIDQMRHLRDTMVGGDEHAKNIVESLMTHIIQSQSNDYMMSQYALISNYLWRAGRTEEGKYYIKKAKFYAEYSVDKEALFHFYVQAGNYEYADDSYSRAADWYFKAVEIAESIGLDKELARIYNNIGSLFLNNGKFSKATEYYKLAEIHLEKIEDRRVTPMLYSNLSELYLLSDNYQEAKKYIAIAEPYVIENGSPIRLFNHEINKWRYNIHIGDQDGSIKCFEDASRILEAIPIGNDYVVGVLAIFDNLIDMNHSELAVEVLERGISDLEKIKDYPNLKKFYHQMLLYYKEKGYELKCHYYMDRIVSTDVILRDKRLNKRKDLLESIEREYSNRKRERKVIDYTVESLSNKNAHLHALNNHLRSIHNIGVSILSTTQLSEIFKLLIEQSKDLFYTQDFAIAIFDEATNSLVFRYEDIINNVPAESFMVSVEDKNHLSVQCFRENREIVINDYQTYDAKRYQEFLSKGIKQLSICYVPIAYEGEVFGVITAQEGHKNAFDETQLEIFRLLATFAAVSFKNAQQSNQLNHLARHDDLTNLYNRRTFESVFGASFEYSKAFNQPITLMLLDVDYFKQYNDYYGHVAGDECLIKVSNLLLDTLKDKNACVARYGGDEFIILLKGYDFKMTQVIIGTLIDKMRALKIPHEKSEVADTITVSIGGVSKVVDCDDKADDLLVLADQALYKTKKEFGRNGYYLV